LTELIKRKVLNYKINIVGLLIICPPLAELLIQEYASQIGTGS